MLDAVEHTKTKIDKPFKFRIIWGSDRGACSSVDEYEFATQAEVDAFWEGVEAAEGWNGYTMLEDGDIVPQADDGLLTVDERWRCHNFRRGWSPCRTRSLQVLKPLRRGSAGLATFNFNAGR